MSSSRIDLSRGKTIAELRDRFKHGAPQSREQRIQSGAVSTFWWQKNQSGSMDSATKSGTLAHSNPALYSAVTGPNGEITPEGYALLSRAMEEIKGGQYEEGGGVPGGTSGAGPSWASSGTRGLRTSQTFTASRTAGVAIGASASAGASSFKPRLSASGMSNQVVPISPTDSLESLKARHRPKAASGFSSIRLSHSLSPFAPLHVQPPLKSIAVAPPSPTDSLESLKARYRPKADEAHSSSTAGRSSSYRREVAEQPHSATCTATSGASPRRSLSRVNSDRGHGRPGGPVPGVAEPEAELAQAAEAGIISARELLKQKLLSRNVLPIQGSGQAFVSHPSLPGYRRTSANDSDEDPLHRTAVQLERPRTADSRVSSPSLDRTAVQLERPRTADSRVSSPSLASSRRNSPDKDEAGGAGGRQAMSGAAASQYQQTASAIQAAAVSDAFTFSPVKTRAAQMVTSSVDASNAPQSPGKVDTWL
eukprot:gene1978-33395_t